jgi:two-component sensor histidine kinase
VQLQVQAAAVRADLNCAIPFGLIVTELLSNCHKHAFADGRPGRIEVRLSPLSDGGALLEVIDDGIGSPPWRDGQQTSLGLRLVHSLTRQIDGQALCLPARRTAGGEPATGGRDGPGTHWQLRFARLQGTTTHGAPTHNGQAVSTASVP